MSLDLGLDPVSTPQVSIQMDANILQTIAKAVLPFLDEATFHLTPEKMQLCKMDPTKTGMVYFVLEKEGFKKYNVSSPVKFTIKTNNFKKYAMSAKAKDILELSDFTGNEIKLTKIDSSGKSVFSFDNIEPTIGDDDSLDKPLAVKYDLYMDMFNNRLKLDIADAFKTGGDEITLTLNKQRLHLYTKGVTGKWSKEYDKTNKEAFTKWEVDIVDDIQALFSLDYLKDVVDACSAIASTVRIAFGDSTTGKPLFMKYLVSFPGKLEFWLAAQK